MTDRYVWSGATGGATGVDWTNAYLTIKAAAEAAGTAAGDPIWVAHDHAETGAVALSITPKNTKAAPGTIACVNRAGSVPPVAADLATTATVTTTGASGLSLLSQADGPTTWQGITFNCGSGAVNNLLQVGNASTHVNFLKNCSLRKLGTTATGSALSFNGRVVLDNTTVQFGAIGDGMGITSGRFEWFNTPAAIAGAVFPTTLLAPVGPGVLVVRGVDLSALGGTLCGNIGNTAVRDVGLLSCKLGAGITVSAAQINPGGGRVNLIDCDSGATNYRTESYRFGGNQFTEPVIVRTGGASDGTTSVSWKIVTDANPRWTIPYESLPMSVWSDTPGSHTVSVYGYWNNASVPQNDDLWIEVEGLTTAGFPISSIASTGKASFLATNAPIPSDASTWGGGAGNTKFKMSAAITTAMKGSINVVCKAAKTSSTFYIDPKIEVI